MSGGFFDYRQHSIDDIADSIENCLRQQGKLKPKDELYSDDEYYIKYPEDLVHYTYPEDVQEKMREAVTLLRVAAIYADRVDWFLSGDDGEREFLERLDEDLKELESI